MPIRIRRFVIPSEAEGSSRASTPGAMPLLRHVSAIKAVLRVGEHWVVWPKQRLWIRQGRRGPAKV